MTTEAIKLELEPRAILGKKVKRLRQEGIVPVHLYGPGVDPRALQCEQGRLVRALTRAGGNTPITVTVPGEDGEKLTFAREIQWDPVRGSILHVDFLAVQATQRISAQVPITLIGESPGAREAGGAVIQQLRELTVEALPLEIPNEVEVDLSTLTDPSVAMRVSDLVLPQNVAVLTDADEVIVRIEVTRAEVVGEAEAAPGEAPSAPQRQGEPEGPADTGSSGSG